MKFCFSFPISMCCFNLSTVKNFNHTLLKSLCVDLKTSSPCWFLNMFFYCRCGRRVANRMWLKRDERTLHFIKHYGLRLMKCINLTARHH